MSKILNNTFDNSNIFTESSIDLPSYATIVDANSVNNVNNVNNKNRINNQVFSATSSENVMRGGNAYSATSSDNVMRGGNAYSATSSVLRTQMQGGSRSATSQSGANYKDVNDLLEMLTSESNMTDSERTNDVELRLQNILNSQNGGNNVEILSEYFSKLEPFSEVSNVNTQQGGGVRYIINEDLELDQDGGARGTNPGMAAFLKLKKHVADKLKISNGVPAGKVAGAVLREVKSKYANISTQDAVNKAMKHLDQNVEKFRKML